MKGKIGKLIKRKKRKRTQTIQIQSKKMHKVKTVKKVQVRKAKHQKRKIKLYIKKIESLQYMTVKILIQARKRIKSKIGKDKMKVFKMKRKEKKER